MRMGTLEGRLGAWEMGTWAPRPGKWMTRAVRLAGLLAVLMAIAAAGGAAARPF